MVPRQEGTTIRLYLDDIIIERIMSLNLKLVSKGIYLLLYQHCKYMFFEHRRMEMQIENWVSIRTLAKKLKVSVGHIYEGLKELEAKRFIKIVNSKTRNPKTKHFPCNKYFFLDHPYLHWKVSDFKGDTLEEFRHQESKIAGFTKCTVEEEDIERFYNENVDIFEEE